MTTATPISTTAATRPSAGYSQGFDLGDLVITAGQVGATPDGTLGGTLAEQVNLAIDNLEAVLAAAGSSLSNVVKTTCFLADVADFPEFDALYRARFGEPLPARSTVGVAFGGQGLLFEIEAIAVK
jgi:2-iminobutanoate/2-iminopropanoate deaminase